MRKSIALFVTIAFVLAMSGIAYASGYLTNSEITATNPHGSYSNSTNKCKACHAVHLAQGSYRLLRISSKAAECDYCHGSGGITSKIVTTNAEGHTMGYSGSAPDDAGTAWSTTSFACIDCHSVHNNNTVTLTGYTSSKLLKNDPDPGEALYWTGTGDESQWCSDCHSANYGLHTAAKTVGGATRYGHDCDTAGMSTTADGFAVVNPGDGVNNGPTCKQCHQSSGYPHSQGGTGRDMLKDTFNGTALDDVCNDCHNTASLP
ncbi:MAG: hypothetical protein QMD66_07875 [Actinomycetota bacterium]|nr:hypothetical protein [Actinomycetota bacterium]MDI6822739.1 hypothetical protein [Actinomycetota bacterium]